MGNACVITNKPGVNKLLTKNYVEKASEEVNEIEMVGNTWRENIGGSTTD